MEKAKKELVVRNGRDIEVSYYQTDFGDYIALANYQGEDGMGVCRHSDLNFAKEQSIERLIELIR